MKEYPQFTASEADVVALLASQRLARIVTIDSDGIPRVGLHVFIHNGLTVEMHFATDDAQLEDVRRGSPVVIEVDEPLATSPSHWLDEMNATNADQFYLCASLWGTTTVITDVDAIATHLGGILAKYQPEGRHSPVSASADYYREAIRYLNVVRVVGTSMRTKFKLGQSTDAEKRERILARLRERGGPLDARSAALISGATSTSQS
jgi:predicted FMN-binding regulatory protein PaiB